MILGIWIAVKEDLSEHQTHIGNNNTCFHPTWYSLQPLCGGSYPVVNHTDKYFVIEINNHKNTDHLKPAHMNNTNNIIVNKQSILFGGVKIMLRISSGKSQVTVRKTT